MLVDADFKQVLNHCRSAGVGQVYQDGAEAHRQQQGRFHLLDDGQIDQHTADDPHDHLLPCDVIQILNQYFHSFLRLSKYNENIIAPPW